MALHTENYISLYSGGGGLDLGFRLANPDARPVLYVEREFQAAALLVDHIEAGILEPAPVWSDTGTLDCEPFADRVDWIIGGFPCQPWSVAGARAGTDDERWLWPHIERLVREIRPRGIFVENVPGLLHGGIEHVLGDLASLGFDAEWTSVRASDVGAPHRRERVFILANSNSRRSWNGGSDHERRSADERGREGVQQGRRTSSENTESNSRELGITSSSGRSTGRHREREHEVCAVEVGEAQEDQQLRRVGQSRAGEGSEALPVPGSQSIDSSQRGQREPAGSLGELDDPDESGLQRRRRHGERGNERPTWPPGPSDTDAWAEVLEHRPDLAPAVESPFRRMADGSTRGLDGLSRVARLRILGNGVVPQQAALAFEVLKERISASI